MVSYVGRATTMAFMWPSESGVASRDSTMYTSLDRMSFMEYTMDTMVLVSLSSSRHFMPGTCLAASLGFRMRLR